MSHFFQQIEAALLPTAIHHAPEGTDPKAVVHQWTHMIVYGYLTFPARRGATVKNQTIAI